KTYIEGVEKLNRERQSLERKMLSALESAVDFSKTQWYQKLMVLRVIQEEEKRQMARVMEAQKRLRMLEKLDERYLDQSRDLHKTIEQKELDEFALQSSRRKVFS
ncbi:MAG: hypothetical protein NTX25_04815, partial [Proteobacteria bacterium]|nr:hypothetical protein [Pseudomonadota bacterium]